MVAERRTRTRPLLRSAVAAAVNGTAAGGIQIPCRSGSEEARPEAGGYLQQLSALHRSGILSDAEFLAARQRLLGP